MQILAAIKAMDLTRFWKYLLLAGLASGVLFGVYSVGYMRGETKASVQCSMEKLEALQKGTKEHAQIEHKIIQLNDTDLDKRLAKWMRD